MDVSETKDNASKLVRDSVKAAIDVLTKEMYPSSKQKKGGHHVLFKGSNFDSLTRPLRGNVPVKVQVLYQETSETSIFHFLIGKIIMKLLGSWNCSNW